MPDSARSTSVPPEAHHDRVFGLDLMRAVAILAVVYIHGYPLLDGLVDINAYFKPAPDGVTLFFVLSGFLVGRIMLQALEDPPPAWRALLRFWVRRWFRTVPNYLLVLGMLAAVGFVQTRTLPDGFSLYVVFSQNLAWPHPAFFPEAWSLAVEEWFYLVVPVPIFAAIAGARIDRDRAVLILVVAVIFAVAVFRSYRVFDLDIVAPGDWDAMLRKQVVTRLDSIMWGVLGAWCSLCRPHVWRTWAIPAFVAGVLLLIAEKVVLDRVTAEAARVYVNHAMLTTQSAFALLLLPALSAWRMAPKGVGAVVTFVSVTSYSAYLLHLSVVLGWLMPFVGAARPTLAHGWAAYLVYWIATFIAAAGLHRFWERPTMALRDTEWVRKIIGTERSRR